VFKTLANAWKIPDLKKKIVFTLMILVLYRLGSNIPVPYVNATIVDASLGSMSGSIFNMLSGSGFAQAHLFALSVSPYITAQIVVQLLTVAIPALEKLSKQGEDGRKKINQITKYLTVGLSIVTAIGYYNLLLRGVDPTGSGRATISMLYGTSYPTFRAIVMIACFCAGASLVMWLADKINEFGIGNGVSLILFVNILSTGYQTAETLVNQVSTGNAVKIAFAVISVVVMLGVLWLIVFITNSERRIPVQYAKRVVGRKMLGGQSSNLPLKVNMSGVMPVIFASSIVSLPYTIGMFAQPKAGSFWYKVIDFFSPVRLPYVLIQLVLIVAFSYFYNSISFNTVEVSNNLKKNGGFIPGIRPGRPTADFIKKALNRVTLVGALFLIIIAGLPMFVGLFAKGYLGILTFGGTSLLIVVGVALETIREMESQMAMRHYKGFLTE
jgi:preprotein translocase subunit SecY